MNLVAGPVITHPDGLTAAGGNGRIMAVLVVGSCWVGRRGLCTDVTK